jgi:hypothetical protein
VPFKSVVIIVVVVDVVDVVVVVVEDVVTVVVVVVVEDVVVEDEDVMVEDVAVEDVAVVEDVVVGVVPPLRTSMAASAVSSRAGQLDVWAWQSFLLFALPHAVVKCLSHLLSLAGLTALPARCAAARTLSLQVTFLLTAFVTPPSHFDAVSDGSPLSASTAASAVASSSAQLDVCT